MGETMERTAVNPVTWSLGLGFNQGEVVTGATRTLYVSGQTASGTSYAIMPQFIDSS